MRRNPMLIILKVLVVWLLHMWMMNLGRSFDPKSETCICIGYCENSKSYRLYNPKIHKIVVSRDVSFDDGSTYDQLSNLQLSSKRVPPSPQTSFSNDAKESSSRPSSSDASLDIISKVMKTKRGKKHFARRGRFARRRMEMNFRTRRVMMSPWRF